MRGVGAPLRGHDWEDFGADGYVDLTDSAFLSGSKKEALELYLSGALYGR